MKAEPLQQGLRVAKDKVGGRREDPGCLVGRMSSLRGDLCGGQEGTSIQVEPPSGVSVPGSW